MILVAVILCVFGLWASSWGLWACWNRPRPHDLLGMGVATVGVTALGLGVSLWIHPGFLG
jgi:hypothetical protein